MKLVSDLKQYLILNDFPRLILDFGFWILDFGFWILDLKQYLILNDFPSVNEAISQNSNMFKEMQVFDLIQSLH